ncbi:MAG TPA: CinA family protein [Pirellulales bacterium]|jgi:nicotinamide mononucleotide (NMN) deamidase PncC|nr:CinA family protein [Pirellulales bacterium]
MPADDVEFVRQIHASGRRLVLATTGGGSRAISRLLTVAGASRSVLEAVVPYSEPALARFLGGKPDQFCSPATACAMAMAAYRRALEYAGESPGLAVGVGCTAGLATDRPKRGPHRVHVAAQSRAATWLVSLELEKGHRTRDEEEALAAGIVLNLLAECCGLSARLPVALTAAEQLETSHIDAPRPWQALLAGEIDRLRVSPPGEPTSPPKVIFSGAFHPLHKGHRGMAAVASQLLGAAVEYEIAIVNADKPALDYLETDRRVRQFAVGEPVWLTRAPTFVEKSFLFPQVTFVVGVDTIERIAAARYYGADPAGVDRAMQTIAAQGCRFLVFGRSHDGRFRALGDLGLPASVAALCREVPAELFRVDISSTLLRRRNDPADE